MTGVALGMRTRLDVVQEHVVNVCNWLNKENHWSRIIREIRNNFTLRGSRVMFKNSEFKEARIQLRKGWVCFVCNCSNVLPTMTVH